MKACSRCGKISSVESFAFKNKLTGSRQAWCKKCFKEYDRLRYHAGDKERKSKNRIALIQKAHEIVMERLVDGCVDCGEKDVVVLEFDHRDPDSKTMGISYLIKAGSRTRLEEELEKCDVVCANCHRRRTAKTFGSWRNSV